MGNALHTAYSVLHARISTRAVAPAGAVRLTGLYAGRSLGELELSAPGECAVATFLARYSLPEGLV